MGQTVKVYVDVEEFSKYKDKWAAAAKWMRNKYDFTKRSSWNYHKDRSRYCCCEMIRDDCDVSWEKLQPYWGTYCWDMTKECAEDAMQSRPDTNHRVYYKADCVDIGELQ